MIGKEKKDKIENCPKLFFCDEKKIAAMANYDQFKRFFRLGDEFYLARLVDFCHRHQKQRFGNYKARHLALLPFVWSRIISVIFNFQ
jgi:hypothetical protein